MTSKKKIPFLPVTYHSSLITVFSYGDTAAGTASADGGGRRECGARRQYHGVDRGEGAVAAVVVGGCASCAGVALGDAAAVGVTST